MTTPPAHYRLAPSSSARWVHCPGSARNDLPRDAGESADLGTLAHELAAAILFNQQIAAADQDAYKRMPEDRRHELLNMVLDYVQFVNSLPGVRYVETKIASKIPEHGGTIDAVLITDDALHVVDFKTGMFPVRARDNTQLMCYMNLAREGFPDRKHFYGTIVQPRVKPPETVEFSRTELDELWLHIIEIRDDKSLYAGPHCRFCPLLGGCETARQALHDAAQTEFDVLAVLPHRVERLIELMELVPVINQIGNRAKQLLTKQLQEGGKVPGYRLAQSRGRRRWKDEQAAIEIIRSVYPEIADQLITEKLATPAQVLKKVPADVVEDLYETPPGKTVIASDKSDLPDADYGEFDDITS